MLRLITVLEEIRNVVNHNEGYFMTNKKFNLILRNHLPKEHGNIEELENFRFANGYGFPSSYKNFVKEFGYGLTLEEFHIYIPMGNYCDSIFNMSESIRNTYINDVNNGDIWFDIEPDGTIEILQHLYPFTSSDNGMFFFWDIRKMLNNEFDIYISDFRGTGFRNIASDLYECLDVFTNKEKIAKLPFYEAPLNNVFETIKPL